MRATTRPVFHGRNLVRCARRRAQPRRTVPTGVQDSRATTAVPPDRRLHRPTAAVRTDRRLHRPTATRDMAARRALPTHRLMAIAGTARPDPITGPADPARARIAAGAVPTVGVRARVAVLAGPPAAATPMADRS